MRPPVRWIRRADTSIWATAMVCRVEGAPGEREKDREGGDGATEKDCRPDMNMNPAFSARPRPRGDPQRGEDSGDPLRGHEPCEQPVSPLQDPFPVLLEQALRARPGLLVQGLCLALVLLPLDLIHVSAPGPEERARRGNIRRRLSPLYLHAPT